MIRFERWFRTMGLDMKWLVESPIGRTARCDRVWNHIVPPEDPRLLVDSGNGPKRKGSKGKGNEYICVPCAWHVYGIRPPSVLDENQEKLF